MVNKRAPQTSRDEHNDVAQAKRSLMVGFDTGTSEYKVINVNENGSIIIAGEVDPYLSLWKVVRDTDFTSGDSPFVFDLNSLLSGDGQEFTIINDGPGEIGIEHSEDGILFSDIFPLLCEETAKLKDSKVNKVRLTHTGTNSSFRILGR